MRATPNMYNRVEELTAPEPARAGVCSPTLLERSQRRRGSFEGRGAAAPMIMLLFVTLPESLASCQFVWLPMYLIRNALLGRSWGAPGALDLKHV